MKKLLFLFLIGIFLISFANATICYQEFANVSTDCGGLSTGNYALNGTWTESGAEYKRNVFDGNWDSATGGNFIGGLLINYTVPNTIEKTSIWEVKDGNLGRFNITNITTNCSKVNNKYQFFIFSGAGTRVDYFCWNGTSKFKLLKRTNASASGTFYEEGMIWNITENTCNYSGSGNWNVNCSDKCIVTDNYNLGGNNLTINGTGTFYMFGNLTRMNSLKIMGTNSSLKCKVYFVKSKSFWGL